MTWTINTPELHHYLLRRWTGKFNPRLHLFDHNNVLEFEPIADTVSQVLWAYGMRMGIDLVHVYEAFVDLLALDPTGNARSEEYILLDTFLRAQIVMLYNNKVSN